MEVVSLHPINDDLVQGYISSLEPEVLSGAAVGSARAVNEVTFGLAAWAAARGPSFATRPFGLSFWEAQVDRALGMLMRPPSQLFALAGIDRRAARAMPIRLEAQAGMMGGAWIPARLIPAAIEGFDAHLERSAKRLVEAELDAVLALELMHAALHHALDTRSGLFEAQDLIVPGVKTAGQEMVGPDAQRLPPAILVRIEAAITPAKRPGLFDRIFRRVEVPSPEPTNGLSSDVTIVERHEQ